MAADRPARAARSLSCINSFRDCSAQYELVHRAANRALPDLRPQTSECKSIPKASDRLACYDKASRSKSAGTSQTSSSLPDQAVDPLAAENARWDAKINNICRGC